MRLRFLSRRAGGRTGLRLPYLSGSALSGSPRHCRALLLVTGLLFAGLEAQGQGAEPLQALRLRGLTARPAALLMSGQSGGEVPLAVLALPMPPTGGESPVAVILEIGLE
ncbi:MAG: hypothetical protein KDD47_06060, partial [Acidobacteria bacterium]|nr:hypothetical protein [Acidobacteriota bacterium]